MLQKGESHDRFCYNNNKTNKTFQHILTLLTLYLKKEENCFNVKYYLFEKILFSFCCCQASRGIREKHLLYCTHWLSRDFVQHCMLSDCAQTRLITTVFQAAWRFTPTYHIRKVIVIVIFIFIFIFILFKSGCFSQGFHFTVSEKFLIELKVVLYMVDGVVRANLDGKVELLQCWLGCLEACCCFGSHRASVIKLF